AIVGATGSPADLESLTRQLGILYMKVGSDGPEEAYTVDHTASILLLDPGARLVGVLSPPHDAAQVSDLVLRIQKFVRQDY
ncbi:MAG: SCO family protein, partial [Gammaproteobacteria bacterium]|nr:SCO family protein [Gammaproteobacteria bacterium]